MMKVKSQKGFTLIELLIVIAVLGILSAVAVPQLIKFIYQGKVAGANAELGVVNTAIQASMADNELGTIDDGGSISADGCTPENLSVGNYIQGGEGKLIGTYYFGEDGYVTDAEYPDVNDFVSGRFE